MFLNIKKIIVRPAPAGKVTSQEVKILTTTMRLIAVISLVSPTLRTAPTNVWVVDTGIPVPEASITAVAATSSAAKPRADVKSVILVPTVAITL